MEPVQPNVPPEPDEPITEITVRAEPGGACLWDQRGYFIFDLSDWAVPASLDARMLEWTDRFCAHWDAPDAPFDAASLDREGFEIAREVRRHVGPAVRVRYDGVDYSGRVVEE